MIPIDDDIASFFLTMRLNVRGSTVHCEEAWELDSILDVYLKLLFRKRASLHSCNGTWPKERSILLELTEGKCLVGRDST